MTRKTFCRDRYLNYYVNQQRGGEMPVLTGARYQRGHGLGSIISGLFRRALPFLKSNAKALGLNLLKSGAHTAGDVIDDVIRGRKFVDSAKERFPQGIKETIGNYKWQTGSGARVVNTRKRKRSPSKKMNHRRRHRQRFRDVFE